jgi:hypothetical protein
MLNATEASMAVEKKGKQFLKNGLEFRWEITLATTAARSPTTHTAISYRFYSNTSPNNPSWEIVKKIIVAEHRP